MRRGEWKEVGFVTITQTLEDVNLKERLEASVNMSTVRMLHYVKMEPNAREISVCLNILIWLLHVKTGPHVRGLNVCLNIRIWLLEITLF